MEAESPEELGYSNIRCNLAESAVSDASFKELGIQLDDLILGYGDHRGNPELRKLIAAEHSGISADDVLITAGAAAALFIVATSLLEKEDHLIVQFPNYANNLATPEAIGCTISKAELIFENIFRLDENAIAKLLRKETRLISITNPHNPTGAVFESSQIEALAKMAEKNNCLLLVDETYRELSFSELPPLAATISENSISVSSISKAHGLAGIRIGWIITRNKKLQELFLAAKEQISICNSALDEEVAYRYLQSADHRKVRIKEHIAHNFSMVENWMNENPFLEWIRPSGGVICFPRFKNDVKIDPAAFYKLLYEKYATLVGPGHWFGMSERYMRIGYGWPSANELEEGLKNNLAAAEESRSN
jgi:aspartate/methionine/tyrosine aminotransferase